MLTRYHAFHIDEPVTQERLTKLGREGYALVAVVMLTPAMMMRGELQPPVLRHYFQRKLTLEDAMAEDILEVLARGAQDMPAGASVPSPAASTSDAPETPVGTLSGDA